MDIWLKIKNQKKDSLITLTRKYANNHDECVKSFFKIKWPVGFYCENVDVHITILLKEVMSFNVKNVVINIPYFLILYFKIIS